MTDKEKAAALAALAAVALAAGAIVFGVDGKTEDGKDVDKIITSDAPVDSKTETFKPLPDAVDAGLVGTNVYKKLDDKGDTIYVTISEKGGVETATYITDSPCAWRVKDGDDCKFIDGTDPGTLNTMKAGTWVGTKCVRRSCTEIFGVPEK